ncbi:MAG TPA: hypothetical protein VGJ20_07485 [Xanthobacteraceae bacterium]|jgi:hypothetical protein
MRSVLVGWFCGGCDTTLTAWPSGAFMPSKVAALGNLNQQSTGGGISILECHPTEGDFETVKQQQLLRKRASQICIAILVDRVLIKNLLHLLKGDSELLGNGALGPMEDQIAVLLWLGHGASVLGYPGGG